MLHHPDTGRRLFRGRVLRDLTALHSRPGGSHRPASSFEILRQPERAREQTSLALQLAFDSHPGPAPAGCRSDSTAPHHLVFLSRDYALELELERSHRGRSKLRGELLSRSSGPLAEVPALLLDGDAIAGYACTGTRGEFCFESRAGADPRLCLLIDFDRCIDLELDFEARAAGASEAWEHPAPESGISESHQHHPIEDRGAR